jgi:hypothetical protein
MLTSCAALLLCFAALLATGAEVTGAAPPLARWLSGREAILDGDMLLYAVCIAVVIRVPAMAAYLRAAPELGAPRLLAIEALTVPLMFAVEPLLRRAGLLTGGGAGAMEVAAGVLIAAASIWLVFVPAR